MSPRKALLRFIIQSALLQIAFSAQCYFSDGTYDAEQLPCFPDQETSGCCGLNKDAGIPSDICLSNGLCLIQVPGMTGLIIQNGCTDRTWDSPNCPSICPKSMDQSSGIYILPCPAQGTDHWCCSKSGDDCCDNAFKLSMGTVVPSSTSSQTSTTTTTTATANGTSTVTVTETTKVTPAADSNAEREDCPVSETTVLGVGVGLGVGLGICLATSLAALWFQRRKFQRQLMEKDASQPPLQGYYGPKSAGHPTELAEVKSTSVFEMGSGNESRTS